MYKLYQQLFASTSIGKQTWMSVVVQYLGPAVAYSRLDYCIRLHTGMHCGVDYRTRVLGAL